MICAGVAIRGERSYHIIMMATLDDKKTKEAAAAAQQQQRAWRGILDRALIDRNARAADRIEVGDFRSASRHAARIMRRLDALRASGMALPAPQHLPAPLRGFGPFRGYYAAWLLALPPPHDIMKNNNE